jgi:hypothetical protein
MGMERVGLRMLGSGPHPRQVWHAFVDAIPEAGVAEPDDVGAFEVELEAEDHLAAIHRARDAIAAAGADDHIAFAEHPNVPEHWRYGAFE